MRLRTFCFAAVAEVVHHSKMERRMSALPPKADIGTELRNDRFVPIADIRVITERRDAYCFSKEVRSPGATLTSVSTTVLISEFSDKYWWY